MNLVIYIVLIISNLWISTKKNRKLKNILLLAFIIHSSYLVISSQNNADYDAYFRAYNSGGGNTFEFGFNLLIKIFNSMGANYSIFLLSIYLFGLYLRYFSIKRLRGNCNYIFGLFYLFPFPVDVVQIRTFLALSIIIFGMTYILSDKYQDKLKFIIFVLLASSIHTVSFIMLFMLLIGKFNKKFKKILLYVAFIVSSVFIIDLLINNFTSDILKMLLSLISSEKTNIYAKGGFTVTYLFYIFCLVCNVIILRSSKIILQKRGFVDIEFVNRVYDINKISLILLPLYLIIGSVYRAPRSLFFINYFIFSAVNECFKPKTKSKYGYNLAIYTYLTIVYLFEIVITRYNYVYIPVFFDNIL